MLVDTNAYIGHWPFRQVKNNTCATRLQLMDEFGVDVSVISNLNGVFYKNTQSANDELYAEMKSNKRFSDRFVPFAVINPIYGGWRDDFKEAVEKMGMKGIRLHPKYHNYDVTDPACVELVKMARDKGLPVAFSIRMVDRRVSSWMDLLEEWTLKDVIPIIKAVPDAKYLILNVANGAQLDEEGVQVFKKANIVMDTSGRQFENLGQLLNTFGKDKFAFGTHSPIYDYRTGLLRIEALRPNEADEKTKDLMRSGNIKRFLGI
jgi:predicted TIM-barrel fold metal-dependent hydrolase